jgi:predicted branched-subunit amino acid permease
LSIAFFKIVKKSFFLFTKSANCAILRVVFISQLDKGSLIMTRKQWFFRGMKAGIPISLGYFAVSIALGLAAKKAGITSLQAALTSLLINASAGEYAGFTLIAVGASYLEVTLMVAVANARYLLMSAALSQKLQNGVGTLRRLLLGFTVTDEIFGVSMIQSEPLDPSFTYGCFLVATTGWTGGTFVGTVLGDILPPAVLSALSVGLYGMFISVFVPEAKKNRTVLALVAISFLLSFAASALPGVKENAES